MMTEWIRICARGMQRRGEYTDTLVLPPLNILGDMMNMINIGAQLDEVDAAAGYIGEQRLENIRHLLVPITWDHERQWALAWIPT